MLAASANGACFAGFTDHRCNKQELSSLLHPTALSELGLLVKSELVFIRFTN